MGKKNDNLIDLLYKKDIKQAKRVLSEKAIRINNIRVAEKNDTILHLAVALGLTDFVKLFLQYGANPLAVNDDGQTPLDYAEQKKYYDIESYSIEFLRECADKVKVESFISRKEKYFPFQIDSETLKKYDLKFLQCVNTPEGMAFVIGECNSVPWFLILGEEGVSYWSSNTLLYDLKDANIYPINEELDELDLSILPVKIKKTIESIVGKISKDQIDYEDLTSTLLDGLHQDQYDLSQSFKHAVVNEQWKLAETILKHQNFKINLPVDDIVARLNEAGQHHLLCLFMQEAESSNITIDLSQYPAKELCTTALHNAIKENDQKNISYLLGHNADIYHVDQNNQSPFYLLVRLKEVNFTCKARDNSAIHLFLNLKKVEESKIHFLDRFETPRGKATFLGFDKDSRLWFLVDGDNGITYWKDLHSEDDFEKVGVRKINQSPQLWNDLDEKCLKSLENIILSKHTVKEIYQEQQIDLINNPAFKLNKVTMPYLFQYIKENNIDFTQKIFDNCQYEEKSNLLNTVFSNEGELALHIAVKQQQEDMVIFLLEHGANPFSLNKSGQSAFNIKPDNNIRDLLDQYSQSEQIANVCEQRDILTTLQKNELFPKDQYDQLVLLGKIGNRYAIRLLADINKFKKTPKEYQGFFKPSPYKHALKYCSMLNDINDPYGQFVEMSMKTERRRWYHFRKKTMSLYRQALDAAYLVYKNDIDEGGCQRFAENYIVSSQEKSLCSDHAKMLYSQMYPERIVEQTTGFLLDQFNQPVPEVDQTQQIFYSNIEEQPRPPEEPYPYSIPVDPNELPMYNPSAPSQNSPYYPQMQMGVQSVPVQPPMYNNLPVQYPQFWQAPLAVQNQMPQQRLPQYQEQDVQYPLMYLSHYT